MGDPEGQVIFPRLETDVCELFLGAARGELIQNSISWRGCAVGVVLASAKYPERESICEQMTGPIRYGESGSGVDVFHATTLREGSNIYALGGRIVTVVGRGIHYSFARERAYDTVARIEFNGMRYRTDIAASV